MARDRLPPLRALRALESFLNTGSVTATARELNVSHSAISHQLRQIEEWAGIRLVRREGRQTELTEAGESLSRVVHDSFSAIRQEIDRLTMREGEPVSVAALRSVFAPWLLDAANRFMALHPDISIYFQEQVADHTVSPEPDISVGFALGGDMPEGAVPVISGRAVPVCSPAYLERHPISGNEGLAGANLLHDEDMRMWRLWFARAGLVAPPFEQTTRSFFSSSGLGYDAALSGGGVALCREALIAPALENSQLIKLSDISIDDDACYYLRLSRQGENRSAAVALARFLAAAARKRFEF
ncbi:LysR family transcriptional regulator [Martelella alba]|uniref:LysR family transcriptional regulator n=1 Tax=Martelella alba TaxID=2590451 RepID=A0A506TXF9_9HYPH|nr:LysR family transcriptional regulator [Martelella alba]TPW26753.1 LysR family transcriptional regulator [Martelella alba]